MDTHAPGKPATRPHRAADGQPDGFCEATEHQYDGRAPAQAMRDARLCAAHAAELEVAPRRAASYYALLEDGFTLNRSTDNMGRKSSSAPGLPVHFSWDDRHNARLVLRSWSGWVRQHLGDPAPTTVDPISTHAAYLTRALGKCLNAEWIPEALEELTYIAHRLERHLNGEPVA